MDTVFELCAAGSPRMRDEHRARCGLGLAVISGMIRGEKVGEAVGEAVWIFHIQSINFLHSSSLQTGHLFPCTNTFPVVKKSVIFRSCFFDSLALTVILVLIRVCGSFGILD